jgi:ABC-type cobalamin/Fe3+-siderophores transport system ATPase subunit
MLQVQNISFGYTEKIIIQNIDFTVPKGQNIAILGESGMREKYSFKTYLRYVRT